MKETMNDLLLEEKNLVVIEKEVSIHSLYIPFLYKGEKLEEYIQLASTISTNKRAFDFMRRSEEIGEAVKELIPHWKDSLEKTK